MFGYFKKNWYVILLLVGLIFISGPIFSLFLTYIQQALNSSLGDWLSFYGAIIGIGISFFVFHFQLFIDKEKFRISQRPEMFLDYSYQVVKASSYVYYHDKYWYGLIQSNKNTKKLAVNSFQNSYGVDNKRDKALSVEIVNNQPLFNLQITLSFLNCQKDKKFILFQKSIKRQFLIIYYSIFLISTIFL
ncbi:TPA: hypothetical protein TZI82_001734 [Streptococcus suis]|nr:hypothetical protein [Streptococcus suis]